MPGTVLGTGYWSEQDSFSSLIPRGETDNKKINKLHTRQVLGERGRGNEGKSLELRSKGCERMN